MTSCVPTTSTGAAGRGRTAAFEQGPHAGEEGARATAGGGHAHSGAAIYLGDNFPKEYRNTLFMANIHGNRLNRDRPGADAGRA